MSTLSCRLILWSVIGTGISSITVQLLTVREFLSQFQGNEITISLTLFCWLMLTGLGSLIARPVKGPHPTLYALLMLFLGLWPLAQLVLIRLWRDVFFIQGASSGLYETVAYVLLMMGPYGIVVGFVLPHALVVLNHRSGGFTAGHIYLTDSIGDIAGGALFTFVLVYWFKPFAVLALTSSLIILIALLLLVGLRRYLLLFPAVLFTLVFYVLSLSEHFELYTLSGQYGRIVDYEESPYGRIVVTREGVQYTFWESGLPLLSDAQTMEVEERIHYPLSQLEKVQHVLLVSGGHREAMEEVLKHHPETVDYVELDPHLTRAVEKTGLLKKGPGIQVIHTDARRYIRTTSKKYDAVLIDLPDPDTFQLNRFFTSEFFGMVKGVLTGNGILSFGSSYSENYLSDVTRQKLSSIYATARTRFQNVLVLPGGKAYFLCRDQILNPDVPALLARKSVTTSFVEGFFHGNVTEERIKGLASQIEAGGRVNLDFAPSLIHLALKEGLAVHGHSPRILLFVVLGLSFVYVLTLRREEVLLFSSGLAAMGAEMMVIFAFQILYGVIYREVGAIITAFLLGLLPGALLGNLARAPKRQGLILSDMALVALLVLLLSWVGLYRVDLPPLAFLSYCFVFSLFCGYQFPVAAALIGEDRGPAARCLAADLIGASVGTLLTGALLIPLWGVEWAIIFLILVKISSNITILFAKRRAGVAWLGE
jgi:spermidine synthase